MNKVHLKFHISTENLTARQEICAQSLAKSGSSFTNYVLSNSSHQTTTMKTSNTVPFHVRGRSFVWVHIQNVCVRQFAETFEQKRF